MLIKEAPEHPGVSHVIANERMQIRGLLDLIVTTDQSLNTAKQIVCSDTNLQGKLYDFEKCVAYLLPICPIALKTTYI